MRKSSAAKVVVSSILPVRKPLPSGLNGTNPIVLEVPKGLTVERIVDTLEREQATHAMLVPSLLRQIGAGLEEEGCVARLVRLRSTIDVGPF